MKWSIGIFGFAKWTVGNEGPRACFRSMFLSQKWIPYSLFIGWDPKGCTHTSQCGVWFQSCQWITSLRFVIFWVGKQFQEENILNTQHMYHCITKKKHDDPKLTMGLIEKSTKICALKQSKSKSATQFHHGATHSENCVFCNLEPCFSAGAKGINRNQAAHWVASVLRHEVHNLF